MAGSRRRRAWVVAGFILVLIGGGLGALAGSLLLAGDGPVQRAPIEGLTARDGVDASDADPNGELPDVINVLVAGSDSREGLSEEERRDLTLGDIGGNRPDTIMVAQIQPGGSQAALLSVPRDLRVTLCDGRVDKINAAFAVAGGAGMEGGSCLVQAVTELTGIPIHHYVEIDVVGFMQVVDTIGGVEMCFEEAKRDARAGLDVPAGCQHLDGSTSLAYVRARSLDGTGDFGRMERQQRFLEAVADEISGAGFLANVPRLLRTLEQVEDAITADESLGLGTMRAIASAFGDADSENLRSTTVPGDAAIIDGISYVVVRQQEADEVFAAFRDGRAHGYLEALAASDD